MDRRRKRSIELGGNLVAINSEEENIWLNENNLRGWIGFTDAEQEGVWKWTNGDPTTYVTWYPDGSPSNTWGTEHYAQNTSLAWGDANNNGDGNMGGDPTIAKVGIAEIPFIRRDNSAYVIVEGRTWEEAEANAIELGGHLVTINDKAENDFIVNVLQPIIWARYGRYVSQNPARYGGPNHPYIGYSDVKNEGTWVWSSGQTSSFENWSPSEPSSDVSNADYAQIYLEGETSTGGLWGQWDDFA